MATLGSLERTAVKLALGCAARSIRRRLGLSQVAFAAMITLRQNTLSQIENGHFAPGAAKLLSLLRLAATGEERGPILMALEVYGILAGDLAPALAPPREGQSAAASVLAASSEFVAGEEGLADAREH